MGGWERAGAAGLELVRPAPRQRLRGAAERPPAGADPEPLLAVVQPGRSGGGRVDVSPEGHSRFWVAKSPIPKGTLVESAQCVYLKKTYAALVRTLWFRRAAFRCKRTQGLLLPCSSSVFARVSDDPEQVNLDCRVDEANLVVRYYARRGIASDEPLVICASLGPRPADT